MAEVCVPFCQVAPNSFFRLPDHHGESVLFQKRWDSQLNKYVAEDMSGGYKALADTHLCIVWEDDR
jgi:hypothetical protein